jgi:hypothetical protein
MHLDFASEYAKRSDEEIRLLVKDRQNLVEAARDALDVEVHRRRRNGFDPHAREPVEPRVLVDEDDEGGNEVVVHSRELSFPKICPRCLAPADRFVRISCGDSSFWIWFPALGLWGYLFFRYPVPFCRSCAMSVRWRRWIERALVVIAAIGSIYTVEHFHLSTLILLLILYGVFALAAMISMFLDRSKQWQPPGIEILSNWAAQERRLQFANAAYEKAFIAMNGGKAR